MGTRVRQVALLALLLLLADCAAKDAETARRGRAELIGLKRIDLLMCAGHPSNEDHTSSGDIWMYEHAAATPASVTVTPVIPVVGAAISPPGGGYCRVQLRLVNDQVTEVSYAGATDVMGAQDAACGPIIANCLKYREGAR